MSAISIQWRDMFIAQALYGPKQHESRWWWPSVPTSTIAMTPANRTQLIEQSIALRRAFLYQHEMSVWSAAWLSVSKSSWSKEQHGEVLTGSTGRTRTEVREGVDEEAPERAETCDERAEAAACSAFVTLA